MLPLLALTWMSAVLAMTDKRSILFQILFAVFDSLQGFVIVMVHCILRREVRNYLLIVSFVTDLTPLMKFYSTDGPGEIQLLISRGKSGIKSKAIELLPLRYVDKAAY